MWVQIPALFAKKVVAQPSFEGCASTFLTKIPKKSFKKRFFCLKKMFSVQSAAKTPKKVEWSDNQRGCVFLFRWREKSSAIHYRDLRFTVTVDAVYGRRCLR